MDKAAELERSILSEIARKYIIDNKVESNTPSDRRYGDLKERLEKNWVRYDSTLGRGVVENRMVNYVENRDTSKPIRIEVPGLSTP